MLQYIGEIDSMKEKLHIFAVCAYGESPYLEECVRSLLSQNVRSDIMMVTSTPNDHIRSCCEKYNIPLIVNTGQGGITQDWNFAYTRAHAKYVTIAHQDDFYEPDYLRTALKRLESSRRPLIFFSNYFEIREGKRVYHNRLMVIKRLMLFPIRLPGAQRSIWIRRRILSFGTPICCPSVTYYKKNLPYAVFQHTFLACEDWEAWEMLSKIRGEFLYSPRPLVGHRIHEGSVTSSIIRHHERSSEEIIMFRKFWPEFIARMINREYARAQSSNDLTEDQ